MSSTCFQSLRCVALRITKLTAGGAPQTGANNGYVVNDVIDLAMTMEYEAGTDVTKKNGNGDLCFVFQEPDKVKGLSLAANFCELDAYLLEFLTNVTLFTSGSDAVGFKAPAVGTSPDPVCVEAWSIMWDGSAQATPDYLSNAAGYWHWVFPFNRWQQGDLSAEDDVMVVPASAKCSENANLTVNGPYDDWPTEVANGGGIETLYGVFEDDAYPTATCDRITVSSAAS